MTPAESKNLTTDDRVGYLDHPEEPPIDYGTVLANSDHGVQIKWDDVENSGCENGVGWICHEAASVLTLEQTARDRLKENQQKETS